MRRRALFLTSFLCRSGQLLSDDGKSLLSDLSGDYLDRLGFAIHDHAHQHGSAHLLGDGRSFFGGTFFDEFPLIFRDFELKSFGLGIICFHLILHDNEYIVYYILQVNLSHAHMPDVESLK